MVIYAPIRFAWFKMAEPFPGAICFFMGGGLMIFAEHDPGYFLHNTKHNKNYPSSQYKLSGVTGIYLL